MGFGDWMVLLLIVGLALGSMVRMVRRRGCGCGCCRRNCAQCGRHGGHAK